MTAPLSSHHPRSPVVQWTALVLAVVAFALLVTLGTWQLRRLAWKEHLIATIEQRMAAPPAPLAEIEAQFEATGDVDYRSVSTAGTFVNQGERHFFATFDGASGFYLYTPLRLEDGRFVFVNRGFVPYDRKEASSRPLSLPEGEQTVTGLARNPLAAKPSLVVPDNDTARNIFYWKDLSVMAATAGLPAGAVVLPFFIDAGAAPNPGGLPIGGVTMVDQPNNHLQYALTWYGLAAALLVIVAVTVLRRVKSA